MNPELLKQNNNTALKYVNILTVIVTRREVCKMTHLCQLNNNNLKLATTG